MTLGLDDDGGPPWGAKWTFYKILLFGEISYYSVKSAIIWWNQLLFDVYTCIVVVHLLWNNYYLVLLNIVNNFFKYLFTYFVFFSPLLFSWKYKNNEWHNIMLAVH